MMRYVGFMGCYDLLYQVCQMIQKTVASDHHKCISLVVGCKPILARLCVHPSKIFAWDG